MFTLGLPETPIPGIFVYLGDGRGLGRFSRKKKSTATISLFHSISREEDIVAPIKNLRRAFLFPQTRVYYPENGNWSMGRVVNYSPEDDGTVSYEIAFPNRVSSYISETNLRVRCLDPVDDPTEVLALGGAETQFFHDRRLAVLRRILSFTAAFRGMDGLASSSIELVPHQVAVVRRVLEDPLRRFLLADEVGMGKTIEAGVVIRQALLDNPHTTVLVVVPRHLVCQWQFELDARFNVKEFPERVRVIPYSEVCSPGIKTPALLVVDEAHHVLGEGKDKTSLELSVELRDRIRSLAVDARWLLLLSATPILGHEATLLSMLALLDPQTYKGETAERFRERVEKRQQYGDILLGLRTRSNPFILKRSAESARSLFQGDTAISSMCDGILTSLGTGDSEAGIQIASELATHISDTYRIHQRLIRTRRADTEGWFSHRGAPVADDEIPDLSHVRIEVDEDDRLPRAMELLEEWREVSLAKPVDGSIESRRAVLYVRWFEALGAGIEVLREDIGAYCAAGSDNFEGEADILDEFSKLFSVPPETERLECLVAIIRQLERVLHGRRVTAPKIVIFCTHRSSASTVARFLARLGKGIVLSGVDFTDTESLTRTFEESGVARLLVVDRSGEEGLNLHFAHAIIHYDLPFSPSRIEQRIGRLDRFGRKMDVIRHRVFLPTDEDDHPWTAWFQLLSNGFEIFNRPVSDVQFFLERIQDELRLALYRGGSRALTDAVGRIKEEMKEERRRLDDQYALDFLSLQDEEDKSFIEEIERVEEDEDGLKQDIWQWCHNALQMGWIDGERRRFRLIWSNRRTLAPDFPWLKVFEASLNKDLTVSRTAATYGPGIELIRNGSALSRAVLKMLSKDDRGMAFCTWRVVPSWHEREDLWTGFRLCYHVEPNAIRLRESSREGLLRRSYGLLPPWMVVLHVDSSLKVVDDLVLQNILVQPYRSAEKGGKDYNLAKRPTAFTEVIETPRFMRLCRDARRESENILRGSREFKERIEAAVRRGRSVVHKLNRRLALRAEAVKSEYGASAAESLLDEMAMNESLIDVVGDPSVRLDAIGFFVVAGRPPMDR